MGNIINILRGMILTRLRKVRGRDKVYYMNIVLNKSLSTSRV